MATSRRGAARLGRITLALTLAVVLSACAGDSGEGEADSASGLAGPLCDVLPQPGEPGGPEVLAAQAADEALTWIPVLTYFEAAARAVGMNGELASAEAITILAPTDDAIVEALNQTTYDELVLDRQDELHRLLEAHVVEGRHSLDDLAQAGTVTTIGGDTYAVTVEDGLPVFDGIAETVCGDYVTTNATIHVIGGVLGELPELSEDVDVHIN